MDTELDPLGIVQIAEEVEHRRIRWYERLAPLCVGAGARDLCRELKDWSEQQVSRLASLGAPFRTTAPSGAAMYRGNSITSSARIMAALAFFVAESSAPDPPTVVSCEWLLTDAVSRSRQAVIFYEGLKGFTRDKVAKELMDEIVRQENEHLHRMLLQLEPYRQARCTGGPYLVCVC